MKAILSVLLFLNILAWTTVYDLSESDLEVVFLDVGQGDAIFIETPQNHQILIDGGPNSAVLKELGGEMPFWDRTVDLVVLTHPEKDHMTGLIEVLKRYKVKNILWTGVLRDTAEYKEWQRLMQEEEANIYIAKAGQQIEGGAVSLTILHPFENLAGKKASNTNNTSIIARLVFGQTSFLFTGDVCQSVEKDLLEGEAEVNSDVLKVGHHGSKTSSAPEFIEAVSPSVAVIQCGRDNPYGHPHPVTLESLAGVEILRTDLKGRVRIASDGFDCIVKN